MSPLDYLLSVIRDSQNELHVRLHAAAKAAPYVHPRLSSVALAPLWPPAHRDAAAPREYPTLINVSSAINVSSPGTVLTRACVDYRANRKAALDKVSDAQRFELSPPSRSSREMSIGLTLNRTDTAGRAERVGLRLPRAN
jgi:hypothetical protein